MGDDPGDTFQMGTDAPHTFAPRGAKISTRLVIPAGAAYAPVRSALITIDAVHGDGLLRQLRVRSNRSSVEAASYSWNGRTGEPLALTVSVLAPRPELSVVHEIGHYLDREAFGSGVQSGAQFGAIPSVFGAIIASEAYAWRVLLSGRRQVRVRLPGRSRPQVFPVDASIIRYLQEPAELVARAYTQFIATVSRDVLLLTQLGQILADPVLGGVYHVQWEPDDFAPILRALVVEFRRRQWIA